MSTYIKDFDYDDYRNARDDEYENFYEELEQQDKEKNRKKQYKMRKYEGYYEE